MSRRTLCRLCVTANEEYKCLFDENGQENNVYEITLKYFDPMLLTPDATWDSKVICLKCWNHIDDFHSFQQIILSTQTNLQTILNADDKENVAEVKTEDPFPNEMPLDIKLEDTAMKVEPQCIDNDSGNVDSTDQNNGDFDDNHFETTDTEDDETKPLIYHINKSKEKKNQSTGIKYMIDSIEHCNSKEAKESKKTKKSKNTKEKVKKVSKTIKKNKNKESPHTSADEMEICNDSKTNKDQKSINAKTLEWDNFIAQWKSELECLHCTATEANFALLRKHYHMEHPNEKLYAKCCDRRFSKRFTLFEHIQLHLNPKVFECDICGRCSTSSSNLAKHKKELHTEEGKLRPFECDICKKNFTSKTNLRIHKEVHESSRDHICSECGKGFPSESRRKIHERMVHNADRICDQCGKSVHGIYALRKHLLEHKGVAKTKWPCDICGAELNSHSSRKRHKQMKHNDGTTAYICSECGKGYTSEPALMSHKRVAHAKELNFKCNYCEKAFKTPRNLREHTATHTGIDIYQCPHCPRTFKMSSNMHHHRKKVHPKEWAEGRVNKRTNKLNLDLIANEVVI